jgi:hypothetical protein
MDEEREAPGRALAGDELLEGQRGAGDPRALLSGEHRHQLVAKGEQARRLEAHQGHSAIHEGPDRVEQPTSLGPRLLDQASREEGAAAAQRSPRAGRGGKRDAVTSALEHPDGRAGVLRLEPRGEGVDQQRDLRTPVGAHRRRGKERARMEGGEMPAGADPGEPLGPAREGRPRVADGEQPAEAVQPRGQPRQVGHHPVLHPQSVPALAMPEHLQLHPRHVHAGGALAPAALAAHAEVERLRHRLGDQRVGPSWPVSARRSALPGPGRRAARPG